MNLDTLKGALLSLDDALNELEDKVEKVSEPRSINQFDLFKEGKAANDLEKEYALKKVDQIIGNLQAVLKEAA